jgi:hypothetical protein
MLAFLTPLLIIATGGNRLLSLPSLFTSGTDSFFARVSSAGMLKALFHRFLAVIRLFLCQDMLADFDLYGLSQWRCQNVASVFIPFDCFFL